MKSKRNRFFDAGFLALHLPAIEMTVEFENKRLQVRFSGGLHDFDHSFFVSANLEIFEGLARAEFAAFLLSTSPYNLFYSYSASNYIEQARRPWIVLFAKAYLSAW